MKQTLVQSVCGVLEAIADEVSRPGHISTTSGLMRWIRLWQLRNELLRWLKE
jgi:hypothetical protein